MGRLYDLYGIFHGHLIGFPKIQRYTLGHEIQNALLRLIRHVVSAIARGAGPESAHCLREASAELDLLRLLVRLSHETGSLPRKGYMQMQCILHEIGKQLGGWLRSAQ